MLYYPDLVILHTGISKLDSLLRKDGKLTGIQVGSPRISFNLMYVCSRDRLNTFLAYVLPEPGSPSSAAFEADDVWGAISGLIHTMAAQERLITE
ncbi:MAG TPA: hypothetical protein VNG90_01885 [Candidatus Acidoferrum sp.]|nr:hypothetical protein [Candidatus Acidoferrum sp.]